MLNIVTLIGYPVLVKMTSSLLKLSIRGCLRCFSFLFKTFSYKVNFLSTQFIECKICIISLQ